MLVRDYWRIVLVAYFCFSFLKGLSVNLVISVLSIGKADLPIDSADIAA